MIISPVWQERIGGGAVVGTGFILIAEGLRLPLGHLASFGPGLFPLILGVVISILGLLIVVSRQGESILQAQEGVAWRPIIFIGAGILTFAALIRSTGLVPATLALVLISSFAETRFRPLTTLVLAVSLAVGGVLLFINGLGLALSPWRF